MYSWINRPVESEKPVTAVHEFVACKYNLSLRHRKFSIWTLKTCSMCPIVSAPPNDYRCSESSPKIPPSQHFLYKFDLSLAVPRPTVCSIISGPVQKNFVVKPPIP